MMFGEVVRTVLCSTFFLLLLLWLLEEKEI
jgi:hypothetical protein